MGKLVKRLMLDDSFAIGRNESWFSAMAKSGLHLKKFGRIFVYFEKREAKNTKYRIDIIKGGPSQEQLEVYHDWGWDYVARNGELYIFSADEKNCTSELHTDPIEQGFSLIDLNKRLKNNIIIMSFAMLLLFGIMFSIYFFTEELFLYMIKGQIVPQILICVVELYVYYLAIRNYRAIQNLKKSLLLGMPINHKEDYRRSRVTSGILAAIFLPLALFTAVTPIVEISKRSEYTLPETDYNLPIIKLMDIEQNPKLMRKESYNSNEVDRSNRFSREWSLLAPIQYEIEERGSIKGETWDDKSGEYSPGINTQFYKLTFGSMAENVVRDLISRDVYGNDTKIKEINSTKLDKMYISEDGIRKQIFAIQDNQVIHVTYYGKVKIENIITLVIERMLSY